MLTRRHMLALAPATLALPHLALAKTPALYTEGATALDGQDVVAYFTNGAPTKGNAEIALKWQGAMWRFASEDHREMFAANPRRYAPQYGGYCAYAVSNGYTAPTVPEAWRIVDGKLYLNFSLRVRGLWEKDIPGRIKAANANWPQVLG